MRSWGCVVTSKSELNRAGVPDYVILQDFDFNFPNKYERWRIRKLPVRIPKSHFPQLNLICAGVTFDVTAGARQSGLNFWSGGVALCCRHENKWRRIRNGIINVCGQFLLLMSAFTIIKLIHFGFGHKSKTYENDKKSANDIKIYLIRAVVPTCSGMLE